jgi:hypothetical protein
MQDQLFDFLAGKDIRRSAIVLAAEDIIRWDFMTRVFSSRKAREANQNLSRFARSFSEDASEAHSTAVVLSTRTSHRTVAKFA